MKLRALRGRPRLRLKCVLKLSQTCGTCEFVVLKVTHNLKKQASTFGQNGISMHVFVIYLHEMTGDSVASKRLEIITRSMTLHILPKSKYVQAVGGIPVTPRMHQYDAAMMQKPSLSTHRKDEPMTVAPIKSFYLLVKLSSWVRAKILCMRLILLSILMTFPWSQLI